MAKAAAMQLRRMARLSVDGKSRKIYTQLDDPAFDCTQAIQECKEIGVLELLIHCRCTGLTHHLSCLYTQDIVDAEGGFSLTLPKGENILCNAKFAALVDPGPGVEKIIRVRMSVNGKITEQRVDVTTHGILQNGIILQAEPQKIDVRPLVIRSAVWGHPAHNASAYNVTTKLQKRIDSLGRGHFLKISTSENVVAWLGDPTFPHQINRVLKIHYDTVGREGEVSIPESLEQGTLKQTLRIGWRQ